MLQENSKNFQANENVISFLKVFRMILSGINNWTKNDVTNNSSQTLKNVTTIDKNYENIFKELLVTLKEPIKIDVENIDELFNDENNVDEINENNSKPDDMPEKPKYIEITINILNRCLKYISSKKRNEQIIAIEAISIGLNIIRNYENDLLPMVHQIWYPFSERLKETDPIILRRCLMLLDVLGRLAKDFIYTKTSK